MDLLWQISCSIVLLPIHQNYSVTYEWNLESKIDISVKYCPYFNHWIGASWWFWLRKTKLTFIDMYD